MRVQFCLAAGFAILLAKAADAAGPYDGTYVGTSWTFTGTVYGGNGNQCVSVAAPVPLTISNGHAQVKWGNGLMQGDVDPNGKLILHSAIAGRFEGQIDANGALKGTYAGGCIFVLTWQRKG